MDKAKLLEVVTHARRGIEEEQEGVTEQEDGRGRRSVGEYHVLFEEASEAITKLENLLNGSGERCGWRVRYRRDRHAEAQDRRLYPADGRGDRAIPQAPAGAVAAVGRRAFTAC